jgi:hypothetical protein
VKAGEGKKKKKRKKKEKGSKKGPKKKVWKCIAGRRCVALKCEYKKCGTYVTVTEQ